MQAQTFLKETISQVEASYKALFLMCLAKGRVAQERRKHEGRKSEKKK